MRFKKSVGLTESERILAALCDGSFLQLWTYPNLHKKPGKELCDLLVVYGDDVLIFSDKSCKFGNSGDTQLDWKRWYKKSVAHSASQVADAEHWIREKPDQIFLDAKCTVKLPIALPSPERMRVHRICVALGASERAITETGRPSLRIKPSANNGKEPFTTGRIGHVKGLVHVFDDVSLETILRELSTTPDFVQYLSAKEALLYQELFMWADSETDLLARYLWYDRTFPPVDQQYTIEPNLWMKVEADPSFLAARSENEASYFWDGLIEYTTGLFLSENLEFGNDLEISEYEQLARLMAGETRFSRRVLSKLILERAERARDGAIGTLLPSCQSDVNYVLYIGAGDQGGDHDEYRKERSSILRARCLAGKAALPEKRFVVGIALDAKDSKGSSEDFVLLDTIGWTAEALAKAEALRQECKYFIQGNAIETHYDLMEYPVLQP
ncbi:MAG: hypothetical protein E5Y88_28385 [Mesorhizobium sp.]|uniref:hypothetical protein n=1 Tax=Mesorhizobium sp. TaxID=1871066 RepID=UPI000FE7F57D|nr:hypothetical protein [Mesorhizobium sp.]RWQ35588.1 MAG: hypothetical protein EOS20_18040 [Mesorhizobium sp.]TIL22311.1 MAG: hypothetical protein E5Y88_28385 [Mesorhizobium sp.]